MTAAADEPLRALTADLLDLLVEARKHVLRNSKLDVLLLRMRDRVLEDANRVDPPVAKPMPLVMPQVQVFNNFTTVPAAVYDVGDVVGPGLVVSDGKPRDAPNNLHGPHQPPPAGNTLPS